MRIWSTVTSAFSDGLVAILLCQGASGCTGGEVGGASQSAGGTGGVEGVAGSQSGTAGSNHNEPGSGGSTGSGTAGGGGSNSSGGAGTSSAGSGGASVLSDSGAAGGSLSDGAVAPPKDAAPSSGCGVAGTVGVSTGMVDAHAKARTYVLAVPAGYTGTKPFPLVFAWHGRGGSGQLARLYFGVEQQSAGQAIFVYPDALPLASQGNQTGWDLTPAGDDVLFFDALLDVLSKTYCIDKNRVFSIGHSFGAYMSNTLGCARGDALRAIAPVSGGGPFAPSCQGTVAAWLAHGTADMTVLIAEGRNSRDHWLKADGCGATTSPVSPAPCAAYAGCQTDLPVIWCEHTGGHDWPAFAASGIWGFLASFH